MAKWVFVIIVKSLKCFDSNAKQTDKMKLNLKRSIYFLFDEYINWLPYIYIMIL